MMTPFAIRSAGHAANYYEQSDHADYYAKDDSCPSIWQGKGAELLGIQGQIVEKDRFKRYLEGHIAGQELGTKRAGKHVHKPAFDLTFSPPKSVSVIALVGEDERVLAAHEEAVKEALAYVEDSAIFKRKHTIDVLGRNNIEQVKTGNLLAGVFMHETSRADANNKISPQLHSHAVVMNATCDEDGNWRSIESRHIWCLQKEIGLRYRQQLASKLVDLGYEIERRPDANFEVLGVPQKVCDAFSLRRDIINPEALDHASEEKVFGTSLLRGTSLSVVKGQLRRILNGQAALTDYKFSYKRPQEDKFGGVTLQFNVKAESKPSTNIHTIIGRNGVGKTTLLNGMISAITSSSDSDGKFYEPPSLFAEAQISQDFFSSLISVSFSAFDPFIPPKEQSNPAEGTCYYYIGLKEYDEGGEELKSLAQLQNDFFESLRLVFKQKGKKRRWLKAVELLESDENFAEMQLKRLADVPNSELCDVVARLFAMMSSGHSIIILTITRLVALTEEKTLVLLDEPESHLHPPLLSAFVRALSDLLHDRNGVAIVATHSPVVLQEIPSSCIWKITRRRAEVSKCRPEIQTFGENVGVLTREIFGLEVIKSGFHSLLEESVSKGGTYQEVLAEYDGQLGIEAKGVLQAMILDRDKVVEE